MADSRTKNTARNAVATTLNRIVGLLIPFVLRTAIIKGLGEQYLGLSSLFSSVLQVLCLADLGFNSAIIYSMYRPVADGDTDRICALLKLYRQIYRTIGSGILIVGIALMPFLDKLISGSYPAEVNIRVVYVIYLANTAFSYLFFAERKALLTAHQRSDIDNNINSVSQLFFDALKLIALLWLKNYYVYILFIPATTFVSGLFSAVYSYKKYPEYVAKGTVDSKTQKGIIKKVSALSIQKIGNTVSTSLDNIVISSFLGLTAVAVYGNYFYIVSGLISFMGGCISSATASIGNSLITESVEKNYGTFKKINMLNQWAITWCIPCLACLYQHFMHMWVGENLMAGQTFVWLMIAYFYAAESRKVIQVFKDAAGMWWADKWKPLVGCIINLTLNILLVRAVGMEGVIFSTVFSYLFVEMPWETIVLFQRYFRGYLADYVKDVLSYLLVICIATAAAAAGCSYISLAGISGFVVKGIVSFLEANLVFLLVFHKRAEFRALYTLVSSRLLRKRV